MPSIARFRKYDKKTFYYPKTTTPMNTELYKKAIIYRFRNGKLCGGDKAAIEMDDGYMEYRNEEGLLHRVDGPAIVGPYFQSEEFWVDGVQKPSPRRIVKSLEET